VIGRSKPKKTWFIDLAQAIIARLPADKKFFALKVARNRNVFAEWYDAITQSKSATLALAYYKNDLPPTAFWCANRSHTARERPSGWA
jgi:hypothetical protein